MGMYKFFVEGHCVVEWKEEDPMPSRAKGQCLQTYDLPIAKRDGVVTYYSNGHCRLEYIPDKEGES
ncbi:hypothetical protein pEaSNUABM37_00049 [Erwinia phage pEa_SNUABM_37]|nr:hypothetical protein pEaSNUABM37_00049 [Erwinia phage pEa_SNUABM_37]QXO10519.1 hypothetical protein pEaSNUABM48_00049 [Erwinia phage pEa_SNUABM_48]